MESRNKTPDNVEVSVSPKLGEHIIKVDGELIGSYNMIHEISEVVIAALGKNAKMIEIKEVE